jgi:ABC-type Fe3+ transport system, periplasmic component
MNRPLAILAALALAFGIGPAHAQAPTGKVTVSTSFPKDVTDPIKKAFEKAHPGVTLDVQNRNTNAGVKYLEETKDNNQTDLFWASAPDAFEVLKGKGLLQKYQPKATGIPEKIGAFPINDPDGYYFGFAASGYGIMWNERYAKANNLPEPKEWSDLAKPVYYDHVSIATPSRSGTTHLTIETILQGEGWEQGWRTIKEMAGNFRNVTERSFGVPEAVNSGEVGVGDRDRLLRLLGAGFRLSRQVRLPHGDDDCASQRCYRRQRAEQGRRGSLHRVPTVAGRPGGPAGAEHPPPSDQPGRLREGTRRLPQPFQGPLARRTGQV